MIGFLAITGSPPFSTFLSEFTILKAALDGGHGVIAALYLSLLALIFIGMVNSVIPMTQGIPCEDFPLPISDSLEELQAFVGEIARHEKE